MRLHSRTRCSSCSSGSSGGSGSGSYASGLGGSRRGGRTGGRVGKSHILTLATTLVEIDAAKPFVGAAATGVFADVGGFAGV